MRPLLVVLGGLCASIGTSLVVWAAIQTDSSVHFEVLEGGLISTNASERVVNIAVSDLLDDSRRPSEDPKQELNESAYHESAEVWFSKDDLFGVCEERASRLVREQIGRDGLPMRIEVIHGNQMPTLIFVRHESRQVVKTLGLRLGECLNQSGVQEL